MALTLGTLPYLSMVLLFTGECNFTFSFVNTFMGLINLSGVISIDFCYTNSNEKLIKTKS